MASDGGAARRIAAGVFLVLPLVSLAACGSGRGITPIRTPFNKGVYLQSRGDLDAAIAAYRDALREDDGDVRARFNLATALDDLARTLRGADADAAARHRAEAEHEYLEVLRRDPANVRAMVNLAAIEHDRGDAAAARQRLQQAIADHPDLALPYDALALRQLEAGELRDAEATLQQALANEPLDATANLLLGRTFAAAGRFDDARQRLREVLRREPDDAGALLALAGVESAAGVDAAALVLVDRVLLADPEQLDAHLLAASLQRRRGDLEAAVWHLWRARDVDRGAPPRRDYAEDLRALYRELLAR